MKVIDVRMETYRWDRAKPIRNGRYVYATAGLNVIKISTDDGVTGIGRARGVSKGIGESEEIRGRIPNKALRVARPGNRLQVPPWGE